MDTKRRLHLAAAAVAALALGACGGGDKAKVGGTVSGLTAGQTVVLQDNGTDTLTLGSNGGFDFATALADGSAYSVTVLAQPAAEICEVSNGTGTIGSNGPDVGNVSITCIVTSSLGGTVTGLAPGAAVTLSNGTVLLPVAADGSFAFPGVLVAGASYDVSIVTQPVTQACTLANASGTVTAQSQTAISVSCD
jgi:hypothetical protein